MARGYPEPRAPKEDALTAALVPEGTCIICKRRRAEPADDKCERCTEALGRA